MGTGRESAGRVYKGVSECKGVVVREDVERAVRRRCSVVSL